ncbi:protein-methionine-sulfoxide reductase catalytic subunit MsrP, partial [Candidatus Sumerlaeota bacterium]|nr:protein-methionine-sulfoxide reductase catalytic subunit MsrP [Candidatus Sumerlaeota bacterium]
KRAEAADAHEPNAAAPASPDHPPAAGLYPAKQNEIYKLDRNLSDEMIASTYNNFYEFGTEKEKVWKLARNYPFRPCEVEIAGLCDSPRKMPIDEIEKLAPLEERTYRHRCVEAWAMAVPWTGFPLSKLIEAAKPKPAAKFIRFVSFNDKNAIGIKTQHWYPWPYYEALRMDEAMNELTLLCTGIYGHALSPSHGAPVRVIVPWKYGYKSPKSIVRIEFTDKQPGTFWSDLQPAEYPFESNVNPEVPHPRWSQAKEHMIGTGEERPTQHFNGYGDYVAKLYV